MRLAIVGAGIGGCSAAYFSRSKILDLEITIFEVENRIGGRIFSKKIGATMSEIGANFFLPINKNIQTLVNALGLKTEGFSNSFGIWDGSRIIFKSNQFAWLTKLNLLYTYGWSTTRLFRLIKKAKEEIVKIYEGPDTGILSYETLIEATNRKWSLLRSLKEVLLEEGIAPRLIKEILEPFTRLIYCQDADVNGYAGITALIGISGTLKHIKKGNETLPKALIESAKAHVRLGQRITRISRNSMGTFKLEGTPPLSEEFDAVILAAPIESLNIELQNIKTKFENRRFRKLYFKTITGSINPEYFGLKRLGDVPKIIMTTANSSTPFVNLITLGAVNNVLSEYHLIAVQPMPERSLNPIFRLRTKSGDFTMDFAYPIFNPTSKFQPIFIEKNFYYINGIESAASTMESSVLGAKNAALLLFHSSH